MTQVVIQAIAREGAVADTHIPAVFYGPKEQATKIAIDRREFQRVWAEAGESTIVTIKGMGEDKDTLIYDVQWHPVNDDAIHVDFYVLEKGKKVNVEVPLQFVGTAPAEKMNGVVVKVMHEIAIEVAPAELPHHIEVDLGILENLDSEIRVKDLKLPASATTELDADDVVVSVTEAVEEDLSAPVGEVMPEEMKNPVPAEEDKKEE